MKQKNNTFSKLLNKYGVLIKKNCKVLINNKLSFSILFIGPIILLALMSSIYFNENSYSFNVGIIDNNNGVISTTITQELEKNGFRVINYQSNKICNNKLQEGSLKACILIPDTNSSNVEVSIDNTNSHVKEILQNILSNTLNAGIYEISSQNIEQLLTIFSKLEKQLENTTKINSITYKKLLLIEDLLKQIEISLIKADDTLDIEELEVEQLNDLAKQIKNRKQDYINQTLPYINDASSKTNNLSSKIRDSNLGSNEKEELLNLSEDVEDQLEEIERKTNSYQGTTYYMNKINEDLDELVDELNTTQNKLQSSLNSQKQLIENSSKNINTIKQDTKQNNNSINKTLNESYAYTLRNSQELLRPYQFEINDAFDTQNKTLASSFPNIFSSIIVILSLFLGAILGFRENNSPSKIRTILSSLSSFSLLMSQIISIVLLLFFQLAIILTLFYLIFLNASYFELVKLLLLLIPFITLFVSIGIIIGYSVKSQLSLFITSLGIVFLFFLTSGKFLPLELLNRFIIKIIEFSNPYMAMENIVRKIVLFSAPPQQMILELGVFMGSLALFFIIALIIISYKNKGKIFYLFNRRFTK